VVPTVQNNQANSTAHYTDITHINLMGVVTQGNIAFSWENIAQRQGNFRQQYCVKP